MICSGPIFSLKARQTNAFVGFHSISKTRTFWSGSWSFAILCFPRLAPSFLFSWNEPSRPYIEIISNTTQHGTVTVTANQAMVAVSAKQSANFSANMVVVNCQSCRELILMPFAYRALLVLTT
jgi:hypothetical protein